MWPITVWYYDRGYKAHKYIIKLLWVRAKLKSHHQIEVYIQLVSKCQLVNYYSAAYSAATPLGPPFGPHTSAYRAGKGGTWPAQDLVELPLRSSP
jgi:hypothetical protein